ncbi:MAG: LamG-like jellyroll fold domain-containing protein [Planctomycetota bacterium]
MSKKLMYLVSFVLVLGMGFSPAHVQADLIGYWRFDESSGTIAADSAGGDNDGTLSENVEWQPNDGKAVGALLFDGTSTAHVEFPTTGMSASAGTVAVWGYLSEPQPSQTRYFFGHTTQPSYSNRVQLYMDGSNTELDLGLGDSHTRQTNIMVLETETWYHVALTWEAGNYVVYVDGEEVATGTYTGLAAIHPFAWIGNDGNPVSEGTEAFGGLLDEVRLYDGVLNADQIRAAMRGEPLPLASSPSPKDGSMILDTWANLSWSPGDFAVSHDMYMGDNFDDVNDGAEGAFLGNQAGTFIVVGFPGFAYPDGLVPGTTYYWRIDEVNDTEPNSPWKGKVWSFSIAPKTAYEPDPADGAELIDPDADLSWTKGFGAKLHTVYIGDNFDDVNSAAGGLPLATATHSPGPLKSGKTYYWRVDEFDIIETFKGDVWSFTTLGAVVSLKPSNGAVDVKQTQVLSWSPGDFAASHEVYFGIDKEFVRDADTSSPEYKGTRNLGSESYDPGKLEWDATYYWRVDEVNNANPDSPWIGPVWSFTTANFLIVDDFEDYNDYPPDEIWSTWIDGYGTTTNGSTIGYADPDWNAGEHYVETTIVHGGAQSMPYFYDNNLKFSEAAMTLSYPRNWTEQGVGVLSLWFYGDASNAAERMYVALNGSATVYHDDPGAAQIGAWTELTIDLQAFAAQGVNLANVNTISIGFGDKNNLQAGGSGMVFFDDIRLFRPTQ